MSLANCVSCGVSNMGLERATLVVVDNEWFCEDCLPKKKGRVKCAKCGREPFTSEEHFKTVDGKYMCTDCMEKAGIVKKYNYIMQAIAATTKAGAAPPLGAATRNVASALGGLRILLDQNLPRERRLPYPSKGMRARPSPALEATCTSLSPVSPSGR